MQQRKNKRKKKEEKEKRREEEEKKKRAEEEREKRREEEERNVAGQKREKEGLGCGAYRCKLGVSGSSFEFKIQNIPTKVKEKNN